jgi:hypothetical protein
MKTKRTLYVAAKEALAAWDLGEGIPEAMEALRSGIEAEHRASADRVLRARVAKMTPERRAAELERHERYAEILRGGE